MSIKQGRVGLLTIQSMIFNCVSKIFVGQYFEVLLLYLKLFLLLCLHFFHCAHTNNHVCIVIHKMYNRLLEVPSPPPNSRKEVTTVGWPDGIFQGLNLVIWTLLTRMLAPFPLHTHTHIYLGT